MLRVGFLGCGDVACQRAATMRALNEERAGPLFEIVAAQDLAPAKSAEFCARWGGRAYPSVGRMLSDAKLDALWIGTPPATRGSAENAALSAGVALWIEPPIAATIRTANALNARIKKSGVPVTVGAPHRYSPELERARKMLAAKNAPVFGLWSGVMSAPLPRAAWRDEAKNGSFWLDGAWSLFDLLRLFHGAEAKTGARTAAETGVAQLGWKGGALASIAVARTYEPLERLEAFGDNARFRVENWSGAPVVELRRAGETTSWRGEDGVRLQMQAFARLLESGKRLENRSPFSDALQTLQMILALK